MDFLDINDVVLVLLLLTIFFVNTLFMVFIVELEQVKC